MEVVLESTALIVSACVGNQAQGKAYQHAESPDLLGRKKK
jgi:hypothetical protein